MGYTIIDILDKAIDIAYRRQKLYIEISNQPYQLPVVKILSKVLADSVNKMLIYYKKLKEEVDDNVEIIDFVIYDKVSFLISEYNLRMHTTDVKTPKEFICFSIDFEKEILALFLDIQGRLVNDSNNTTSITYTILTDIIKIKVSLINDLESHR